MKKDLSKEEQKAIEVLREADNSIAASNFK
jgi:hypothetical protein